MTRLKHSAPVLSKGIGGVFHVVAFAVLIPLTMLSIPMLLNDWQTQDFVGAVGSFTWPVWPTRLAIVIGCLVLMGQIVRCGYREFR